MKVCRGCLEERPLHEFPRSTRVRSGRAARCFECERKRSLAKYYANREANLARQREYIRTQSAEGREARRRAARARYARNREREQERARQRRAANVASYRQAGRRWTETHPEKVRAQNHRQRAGIAPSPDVAAYIGVLSSDPCVYCGGEADQIDHITPMRASSPAGWVAWDNLTASCRRCNASKSDRPFLVFLHERRPRLCKCGCGRFTTVTYGRAAEYISGHNRRKVVAEPLPETHDRKLARR